MSFSLFKYIMPHRLMSTWSNFVDPHFTDEPLNVFTVQKKNEKVLLLWYLWLPKSRIHFRVSCEISDIWSGYGQMLGCFWRLNSWGEVSGMTTKCCQIDRNLMFYFVWGTDPVETRSCSQSRLLSFNIQWCADCVYLYWLTLKLLWSSSVCDHKLTALFNH